jgi:hypothetical protein
MQTPDNMNISSQDVLAAIGFNAARISAVIQQHAMGAPFPPADQLVLVLQDMLAKAMTLQKFGGVMDGPDMSARVAIKAELS